MSTATISCSTPDAIIRYEIGGVDPTESSPLYSSPVEFSGEIRAKAWKEGMEASDIAVAVEEDDVPYYHNEILISGFSDNGYLVNFEISDEDINRIGNPRYRISLWGKLEMSGISLFQTLDAVYRQSMTGSTMSVYFCNVEYRVGTAELSDIGVAELTMNSAQKLLYYNDKLKNEFFSSAISGQVQVYLVIDGYEPAS